LKHLNQLRIDAGYSIADIARIANVSEATACRWLSGTGQPDIHQQRILATTFGVDIDELDERESTPQSRPMDRLRHRLTTTNRWNSSRT
jgi:transcriptional regulator with XRE-family HTH domain